jgi:hypothetical protein
MTGCNTGNIFAFKPTGEKVFDGMKVGITQDTGVAVLKR